MAEQTRELDSSSCDEDEDEPQLPFPQPPLDDFPPLLIVGADDINANGIYYPAHYENLDDSYMGSYCAPKAGRQVWRYVPPRVATLNPGPDGTCATCSGTGQLAKQPGVRSRKELCDVCFGGAGVDLEYCIVFIDATRVHDHETVGHCWELGCSRVGRGQHHSVAQAPPEAGYTSPPFSSEPADNGRLVLPPETGWYKADDLSPLASHDPLPEMQVLALHRQVLQLQLAAHEDSGGDGRSGPCVNCLNLAGDILARVPIDFEYEDVQSFQKKVATKLTVAVDSLSFVLPNGQRLQDSIATDAATTPLIDLLGPCDRSQC